jgi:hypothetical protein
MAKGMSGLCPCMHVSDTLQLKKEYDIVKELRNLSGIGWDDVTKHVKALPAVWDEYLKVHLAHIYAGLTCSSHSPLPFRVMTRQNPSARRDSLYSTSSATSLTSSATSSTALALLVSSHSGQAKPGPFIYSALVPCYSPGDNFDSRIDPVLLGISKDTTLSCRPRSPLNWENNKYSDTDTPNQAFNKVSLTPNNAHTYF